MKLRLDPFSPHGVSVDNSTVTVAGGGSTTTGSSVTVAGEDYLTLSSQEITANPIDLDNLSASGTPSSSTFLRGDNTWATPAGSGDVSKVGTPVNNQVSVWTGDGTIEGDADLTFDTSTNTLATVNIAPSGTVDGRDIATDGTKLDGIESGADVTDTANVTAAGALMDSEVTSLSGIKTFTVPDNTTISAFGATLVDDADASTARTTLGVVIGTNVQAYDADLTTWAGITPGAGVGTFLATPSSANLATAVTDETGSGSLVFGTSPTIITTNLISPVIRGSNSNVVTTFSDNAGASTNYTNIVSRDAADPYIESVGASANIGLNIVPKGTGRLTVGGVNVPTVSSTDALTSKTIALGSNTVSGTTAEFNTANSDADFYTTGGTDVAVTDGGTGRSTGTTAYSLVATGTTATGAQQTLANGATTEVLVGGGASALPVWTTATGSGAPVRATSPTLTTPRLGSAGFIADANGNEIIATPATVASAVNYLRVDNSQTLSAVSINTTGDDTNVALDINTKGSGVVSINGALAASASNGITLTNKTITDANNTVGTGTLSNPYKFSVYHNTTQSVTTGGERQVAFNTEAFDTGGNFASNLFTAPVTGFYHFSAFTSWAATGSQTRMVMYLYVNGSAVHNLGDVSTGAAAFGIGGSALVSVTSGQTVGIYVQPVGANTTLRSGQTSTWFNGYLISKA
jgi:hypothetical protein